MEHHGGAGRPIYRQEEAGGNPSRSNPMRAMAPATYAPLAGCLRRGDKGGQSHQCSTGWLRGGRRRRAATVSSRAEHGGGDAAAGEGISGAGEDPRGTSCRQGS